MSDLIDTVARLNAGRDRDSLERALLNVIVEVFDPLSAVFCRIVSLPDGARVHERLTYERGGAIAVAQLPENLRTLARVERCGFAAEVGTGEREDLWLADCSSQGRHVYVAPVRNDFSRVGWIEVETDAPLEQELAATLAAMMRVYSNHVAVLDYSERDALTRLRNRKTFDDTFVRLVYGAPREPDRERDDQRGTGNGDAAHWLGMADIDHFKRINDTYGHQTGDRVLETVSRLTRETIRCSDSFARWGGEEFMVLLPMTPLDGTISLTERIRQALARFAFDPVPEVTCSFGVTEYAPGDTSDSIVKRADEALYWAKTAGRNRIELNLVTSPQ